jgi:LPS-assembly protein
VAPPPMALLTFFNVPILPIPSMSFPLSDKRKSGLLPPTIGVDSINGVEYRQPYYWDIAPNRDATLYPRVMSKRGVEMGGEFRYLEPAYRGQIQANVLPGDKLRDRCAGATAPARRLAVFHRPTPASTR